jgi:methylated-DNA-protein-cysteine methyltransferase-like protein
VDRLPWHRLVNVGGRLKFAAGSPRFALQTRRLRAEGVRVTAGKVDLAEVGWTRKPKPSRKGPQPKMFG